MTQDTEIDVDELRTELEQIKGAMGIQERYPTQFKVWLVYGLLVLLASLGSQAVVTFELNQWGHAAAWFGFMAIGVLYERIALEDYETSGEAKPNMRIQGLAIVGYLVVVFATIGQLSTPEGVAGTSITFALILGAIGAYYVVVGSSLAAYYIRSRDRYAFYVGGAWILVYAALMPQLDVLQEWGYAVFGVLFALHGVGSYVALSD